MLARADLLAALILAGAGVFSLVTWRRLRDDVPGDPVTKEFVRRFRKDPEAAEAWLIEAAEARSAEIAALRSAAQSDQAAALKLRELLREDLETDEHAVARMRKAHDPQLGGALAAAEESRRALRVELEQLERHLENSRLES